jgi:serine/threonine protein kinase
VGTEEYIAPETIIGNTTHYATDLWSLGVMLYQLLTGKVPFQTQMEVTNCNVPSFPLIFDEFAKDLITRLL